MNLNIKLKLLLKNILLFLYIFLGWIGFILLILFCINAAYGGKRLGTCWEILEERYPQHRNKTRNPYATIAFRAVGYWGR